MLSGVKILAVEQYGAGPFGTQFLVDMGAEVVKVENPLDGGDTSRGVGPAWHPGLPSTAQSVFFQGLNRGKKSITLDLNSAQGQSLFQQLVKGTDAVVHNLRGDVPAKLGLTYSKLAPFNARVVCAHLTGYGRDGERASWPGYDYLMQAETGYFHLTGEPGSAPSRCGLSLIDLMTGAVTSMALLAGILDARTRGVGRDVDVSLFDLSLYNLNYIGHWYLNGGLVTERLPRSAHPALTPCQSYKTRDGWIYVMCNKEKFWGKLCECISRQEWTHDPRFLSFKERLEHRDLLTDLLDDALSARTTDEWLQEFAGRVPGAPIYDVRQALESSWVFGSDRIADIDVEGAEPLRLLASPVRYEGRPAATRAPSLGEHRAEVLAGIGIDPGTLDALRRSGIV